MKTRQSSGLAAALGQQGLPDADSLAALRAWYEGFSASDAVARYLGSRRMDGESSRGILGRVRRQLAAYARQRHREDLAAVFSHSESERSEHARAAAKAIELLPTLVVPEPLIGDDVTLWLPPRAAKALHAQGIRTLAALTLRVPRRRRWWVAIPGLGAAGARQIETFFAAHPQLTERARALVVVDAPEDIVPWEHIVVPRGVDGSQGTFRAPRATCTLSANNDYDAVHAWLALHESTATQRAYRKEAERLILWAIVERGKALSSLTTEDAVAYRAFLRHPAPRTRWVGPPRPRSSPEWKPFAGSLSARSSAYALTVLGAMYRWLVQQRYTLANPFAGIKVRGAARVSQLAPKRAFSDSEWNLIRTVADGLEWSYGWEAAAAQRLRFVLDFAYGTGLRNSELVGATLGQIETDDHGDHWLHVVGKGSKAGKVALPPLAWNALNRHLAQRRLPTTPAQWSPNTPLLGSLEQDSQAGITSARLWNIVRRFFDKAAEVIGQSSPATVDKLRRASPHWMRHTHASHSLARGAELTSVRDNLRHASLSTTSIYLHGDEVKRARQLREVFADRE
ncbi:MAG TPA: phage integrase family protein [Albitalea sp.]|uniref:phage integrase family protein n=1 Tax=Piscinibacter sp. TaxID=1903157 RepID=UPI002ED1D66C